VLGNRWGRLLPAAVPAIKQETVTTTRKGFPNSCFPYLSAMKTTLRLLALALALVGCSKDEAARPANEPSIVGAWNLIGADYVNTFTDGHPAASGSVTYAPGRYRRVFTTDRVQLYAHDTLVADKPYTLRNDSLFIPPANPNRVLELTGSRLVFQSRFETSGATYITTTTATR
jgi:hypothetical protein